MRSGMVIAAVAALVLSAGVASSRAAEDYGPLKVQKTSTGSVLADPNGMTLYTFKKDKMGVSNCYDDCAKNWPPLMAASDAKAEGAYSIVERKDGERLDPGRLRPGPPSHEPRDDEGGG